MRPPPGRVRRVTVPFHDRSQDLFIQHVYNWRCCERHPCFIEMEGQDCQVCNRPVLGPIVLEVFQLWDVYQQDACLTCLEPLPTLHRGTGAVGRGECHTCGRRYECWETLLTVPVPPRFNVVQDDSSDTDVVEEEDSSDEMDRRERRRLFPDAEALERTTWERRR